MNIYVGGIGPRQGPKGPDMQTVTPRMIAEAVEIFGGIRRLAAALDISERTVRHWLDGTRQPRPGVYRDLAAALARLSRDADRLARRAHMRHHVT